MKTAISIPDAVYERAERQAASMGVTRSQFYVSAVEQYLEKLLADNLTQRINEALDIIGDSEDELTAEVTAHSRRLLALTDDEDW